MILYAHHSSGTVPDFLKGASGVCMRRVKDHYVYGVGHAAFLGYPPEDAADLGEGWKAWINADGAEPEALTRAAGWCHLMDAEDQHGRIWAVPLILNEDGSRAFRSSYDEDGLPVLTPEQKRLMDFAVEARRALATASAGNSPEPFPMSVACKWAAAFIASTNHISARALGRLHLMDDKLIMDVLVQVTGAQVSTNA